MSTSVKTLPERLHESIREVPDFPINGVLFKDISPVFLNPTLTADCISHMADQWKGMGITKVLGIESRGFLLGPGIANQLDCGFVMVRKAGKLPPETHSISYSLEYGNATIEMVRGSVQKGDKVLIHDDLLATGGTATAAAKLATELGAEVMGFSFLLNLRFLGGEQKLFKFSKTVYSALSYDE